MSDELRNKGKMTTCEICEAIAAHPKCDGCNILCGEGHLDELPSLYKDHMLCSHCIDRWHNLDKIYNEKTTWFEFLGGGKKDATGNM